MTNSDLTRRTVLGVLGSGAAATVLAGCGSDSEASTGGSSNGASSGGGASAGGSKGTPLVAAKDVPVGSGVILKDQKVVVTQPTKGTFKAFSATCTHQGCLVGTVSGDEILCPCHGSVYSTKDGSVLGGPAPSPLPAVQVEVKKGEVVKG